MSSRACGLVFPILVLLVVSCSSPPEFQTPADAARAKVSFLRREGARLSPYQTSLIQQLPYTRSPGTLGSQMDRILVTGEMEPGQTPGYRRTKLSDRLDELRRPSNEPETPGRGGDSDRGDQ